MIRRAGLAAIAVLLLSTSAVSASSMKVDIYSYGYTPRSPKIGVGRGVHWSNTANRQHTVTPNVPAVWPFTGYTLDPGGVFAYAMQHAGTFPYHCAIHPSQMTGKIKIKMSASPASGNTATIFTIRVATIDAAPGFQQDVQWRKGRAAFTDWISVASQTITWDPNNGDAGTWGFRTRYTKTSTGEHTDWSPVLSIRVN